MTQTVPQDDSPSTDRPGSGAGSSGAPGSPSGGAAASGSRADAVIVVRASQRPPRGGFLAHFPQLFLIPLLLVIVCTMVYLLFIAAAKDTRGVEQLLADMESGGEHSRRQDAYALAQLVKERERTEPEERRRFSAEETSILVRLLDKHPDDEFLRPYLIKTLGRAGQTELATPVLLGLADKKNAPGAEHAAVLQALGFVAAPQAVPRLLQELETNRGDGEWEFRLYAVIALVNIADRAIAADAAARGSPSILAIQDQLRRQLKDPRREISWNTAYYLAFYFHDAAGEGLLRQLLDVSFLDSQAGAPGQTLSDAEKQSWMLLAVSGLAGIATGAPAAELDAALAVAKERRWTRVLDEIHRLRLGERDAAKSRSAVRGAGEED